MNSDETDPADLAENSLRGDGLATGSAPQEGLPDIEDAAKDAAQGTARGGEGLAENA